MYSKVKDLNGKKVNTVTQFRKNLELTLLALPPVICVFIFCYIPLYGLILPFKDFKPSLGFIKSPWVGFKNFKFLLTSESIITITRNTIVMNALFIFFGNVIAIAFALMIFELSRNYVKVYQTAMFIPYFVSWVMVAYVFLALFDMNNGFINKLLVSFGGEPVMWYNEPKYWPILLIAATIWKGTGYSTIIYYTGLLGIDSEYYEASYIDGANRFQQIYYISLPLLKPLIIMLVILAIGRIFYSDFGLFYNVTQDSALLYPTTDVVDTYVYRALRSLGDIGMASAAGLYQSIVGFLLVLATNLVVKKLNPENSLF